jgi:CRP-like cAMP-binding protein
MQISTSLLRESLEKHVTITDEEFDLLLSHAVARKYRKGQFIVHEGALARRTHFINKGAALAFFVDQSGDEHVIQFAVEGWWISDIHSYVLSKPALFSVRAIEDCELFEFSYDDLEILYKDAAPVQSYFLRITQIAFANFQERMLFNLSLSAEERYLRFLAKYPKMELRFPQKVIASYLGMSAEFYSKIKKKRLAP